MIRLTLTHRDYDSLGVLTIAAHRRVQRALWNVPSGVRCVVDLGPCRHLQLILVSEIALHPVARTTRFEGEVSDVALDHEVELALILGVSA